MSHKYQRPFSQPCQPSFLHAAILLFICAAITLFSFPATAQNVDINILKSINPRHPNSDFWGVTSSSAYWLSGGISFGTLVYGLVEKDKEAQRHAYETLISIGISTVVSEALKVAIDRERPADEYPAEVYVIKPIHGKAFPSGHTTLAFATATSVALEYKKWYVVVPAYTWAGLVGYSRMYKGYHAPSDIIGGAAVGIGSGYLSHWLTKKFFKTDDKKQAVNSAAN